MDNLNEGSDSGDDSDEQLTIVESPPPKKKRPPIKLTSSEQRIIDSIEAGLEKRLEEKATKVNLNATHVKNIIKNIITHESVLELIRKAESVEEPMVPSPVYEPKLTRSKARELLSNISAPPIPWVPSKPKSKVEMLINEELQDESTDEDDEYVPATEDATDREDTEKESEDDRDSSVFSDTLSFPPPTPPTPIASPRKKEKKKKTDTSWSEDGVFKIPEVKTKEVVEDDATIAKRTRSKLCLSDTPLEEIEEAFVPPDISTDLYDMDCDNDDWLDFLKKFTRPLDEVEKTMEDEEQDPEYNILYDENLDKEELRAEMKEELRIDKAVKITKKELNSLIDEIIEYSDFYANEIEETLRSTINNTTNESVASGSANDETLKDNTANETVTVDHNTTMVVQGLDLAEYPLQPTVDLDIDANQILLLQQQIRQHVQLLTQNFIQTYHHPELHHHSPQAKEYLLNLKELGAKKETSLFNAINLKAAVQLVEKWEATLAAGGEEVANMERHISHTLATTIQRKQACNEYIPTFATLVMKTISESDVFIYPSLLPKIPFKSEQYFGRKVLPLMASEESLIALGLEQFVPVVCTKGDFTHTGVKGKKVVSYIQEYILTYREPVTIYNTIHKCRYRRCGENPIKYYFEHKQAPTVVHYVSDLNFFPLLPPCKRPPEDLPYQWQKYIYPDLDLSMVTKTNNKTPAPPQPLEYTLTLQPPKELPVPSMEYVLTLQPPPVLAASPGEYSVTLQQCRKILPKGGTPDNPLNEFLSFKDFRSRRGGNRRKPFKQKTTTVPTKISSEVYNAYKTEFARIISKPSPLREGLRVFMINNFHTLSVLGLQRAAEETRHTERTPTRDEMQTQDKNTFRSMPSIVTPCSTPVKSEPNTVQSCGKQNDKQEKDSIEDLPSKKEPSAAEKKRAKIRKELFGNITMTEPEDPAVTKQKDETFAKSLYDKMCKRLHMVKAERQLHRILNEHFNDAVELYDRLKKAFRPKCKDLLDEFLSYLRERESAAIDELVPWIKVNYRAKFLKNLETHFKDQPAQLNKVIITLAELSSLINATVETMKVKLLPLFKGCESVNDIFFQSYLFETPSSSSLVQMKGLHEAVDLDNAIIKPEAEEVYEDITVPVDIEHKYITTCDEIENYEFKSRSKHRMKSVTKKAIAKGGSEPSSDDDESRLKPGSMPGQQKRLAGDISDDQEDDPKTPEFILPDEAPSESEFCEDDSESDRNTIVTCDSNAEELSWKREEDKIILETFRSENDKESAFKSIAYQLEDRSISQIRRRFDTLMKILMNTTEK